MLTRHSAGTFQVNKLHATYQVMPINSHLSALSNCALTYPGLQSGPGVHKLISTIKIGTVGEQFVKPSHQTNLACKKSQNHYHCGSLGLQWVEGRVSHLVESVNEDDQRLGVGVGQHAAAHHGG